MPELPEVETIRRDLAPLLIGRSVVTVDIADSRLLSGAAARRFQKTLLDQPWRAVDRKGKYLIGVLATGWKIVFHLRMTGQLITGRFKKSPPKNRMLLTFDNGMQLAFCDQRRFAEVLAVPPRENHPSVARLGPDPLNDLTKEDFVKILKARTTRIKPLLMDQQAMAGIGNIYAQEALFSAGIRPGRSARTLTREEAAKLFEALREILLRAIRYRGSTSRNYRDVLGKQGRAQTLHQVYRRGGKPCLNCGRVLLAKRVGGRGTVFCSNCQK